MFAHFRVNAWFAAYLAEQLESPIHSTVTFDDSQLTSTVTDLAPPPPFYCACYPSLDLKIQQKKNLTRNVVAVCMYQQRT